MPPTATTPAGRYRHRVTLQRRSTLQPEGWDEHGQPPDSWEDVSERWAEVRETGGSEQQFADGVQAAVTHEVRMRYDPLLAPSPKMRLLYRGRVLQIGGVTNPDGRKVESRLQCSEEV